MSEQEKPKVEVVYVGGHGGMRLVANSDATVEVLSGDGRLYCKSNVRLLRDVDQLINMVDVARGYTANAPERAMLKDVYRAAFIL